MNFYTSLTRHTEGSRLATLLLLLTTVLASFAQNVKVSMEDFEIAPGEQKVVSINVTNDVPFGRQMGGDIFLPEGLKVVPNEDGDYLTRNMTRCTTSHALSAATKAENPAFVEGQIRFSLQSASGKMLKGNEGAVVTFTVEATATLAPDSKISFRDAWITNSYEEKVVADCEANVHNSNYEAPVLELTAKDFSLTPSKQVNLSFVLTNNMPISAFQANITLPEGLEFVENEDGDYATFSQARLTSSHVPSTTLNGKTLNVMLYSSKSANVKGEDGELFYVTLKATGDLAESSTITIDKIVGSTSAGDRKDFDAFTVTVSNPDIAAKTDADAKIADVKNSFESSKTAIAACAESVQTAVAGDIQVIAEKIANVEASLSSDVANGDVAANAEARNQAIAEVMTLIAALNQKADDAQKAYEEEQARLAANEAAYTKLTGDIAKVQATLDAAKTEIETNDADVAAQFTETIAGIQSAIQALTDDLQAKYEATELTAESTVDTTAVSDNIASLLADAAEAQKAYEEEQARLAANEAAYTKLTGDIAKVQATLDAAKTEIETNDADVAAQFTETIAGIQSAIQALTDDLQAKYDATELTAESTVDTTAVSDNIAKLLEDAAAAQKAYEEEQARLAANEAAYTKLTGEIAKIQATLDAAKAQVETEAAEVAEQFTETIAGIQSAIQTLTDDLQAKYEATELTAESTVDTTAVSDNIAKLLEDAAAAQKAYEEEQARLAANEAAYTKLTGEIAKIQATLDAAKAQVETEAADVAEQFTETIAGIQSAIQALTDDLKAKYDATELTAESTVDTTAVSDNIAKLLEDAAAAQKIFEEDAARYAANEAAYAKLTGDIAKVQATLDAAKKEIETNAAGVAKQFEGTVAEIQSAINAITADVRGKYEAIELTAESTVDTTAVSDSIAKLLVDAAAAQKVYEENAAKVAANEAAYTRLTAEIATVQATLDAAKEEVRTKAPNVASRYNGTITGIQSAINALSDDVKAKYEAIELTAESTVNTSDIISRITKLLSDATAAQKAYEDQLAKENANEAAFARLSAEIATVQAMLDTTVDEMNTNAADVADEFAETVAGIQKSIDDLKADLLSRYNGMILTQESTVNTSGIISRITKLLSDATAAQKAYEANEEQFKTDCSIIDGVKDKMAEVQKKIDGYDASVAEAVADDIAAVMTAIEKLTAAAESSHDDGTSVNDAKALLVQADNVAALIAALQKKAEAEQEKVVTGIGNVSVSEGDKAMYDLSGRKIQRGKGLVIIGKKKYVVR